MLYLCVNVQKYGTTIKLHDIKFRKMDKFKYLELIIPENDNCDVRLRSKFKQDKCGWGKKLLQKYLIKKILAKSKR